MMIGYSKEKGENYPRKLFQIKEKETRTKI